MIDKQKNERLTPEEYFRLRSNVAKRVNKARGVSEQTQQFIKELYFNEKLTAKDVADRLGVTHGSVRSTISRAYASMSLAERKHVGKNKGTWSKEIDK